MKFLRKRLKNGMTVVMEQRELPVVALSISNRHGAGTEDADVKGVSHVIEHMVFTGTKTRTHEDISREIEKKGGILNAFTANEVTSFWFKLPSEHVFAGLEIMQDILNNAVFDPAKFEKEKKVILEEIKMYHDTPERYVYDLMGSCLYAGAFGLPIAGDVQSVRALDRDRTFTYFREHYTPEHFIVSIVGNADFAKICALLDTNFQGRGRTLPVLAPKPITKRTVEERAGIDQAHFLMGMHAPLPASKEHYALEVLDAYLANGMSSRLFLKIREEKGLAYTVRGSINAERNYSYYTIYTGTTKKALGEVEKIIAEEFGLVENMSEQDLQEAKALLIGQRAISREESTRVMTELLFAEIAGKAEDYYKHDTKILAVKLGDVKKLARELIKKYSVAAVVPQ